MAQMNKGDETIGTKSKFLNSAEQMKEQLGPALCLAKWKQVSFHLPTGLNNSCYHPPLHAIDADAIKIDPSALHNTEYKKQQRQMMLAGEKPTECSYCWNMENEGKLSDRHYRSGEPWAAVDFESIKNSTGAEDVIPSYVEVNFNHACNLKCSYCSPQFSSSWADEVARLGAFPTSSPHNSPDHFMGQRRPIPARESNPYVDAFWAWWPDLYPHLEHFRMTGGEPLLDKNTYRVFDYVLANPSPKLHLNVTSNFSVDEKSWQKYLTYVKAICDGRIEHFMQYVSLDGWGKQAEYMRNGLDFDLLWDRVNQFLTQVPNYSSLTFIITMNNLSVTSLDKLFAGILGLRKVYSTDYQRVWFDTPVLREPAWQSLQILPESYAEKLEWLWAWMVRQIETEEAPFKGFKDYELHRLDRDIAWMRSAQLTDHSRAKADFYRFFSEHDRRRGTDFVKTFPEMRAWWEECAYHARQS
jgi:organic radical activating enzyme